MLNTINTIEIEKRIGDNQIEKIQDGIYRITKPGEKAIIFEVLEVDLNIKTMTIRHNHSVHSIEFKNNLDLVLDKMGIKRSVDTISTSIKAPMPGKVIDILIKDGDQVAKGDGILILEAMKMENVLKADHDCIIKKTLINEGVNVEKNQILVELG